jgi:hypothetical protein
MEDLFVEKSARDGGSSFVSAQTDLRKSKPAETKNPALGRVFVVEKDESSATATRQ